MEESKIESLVDHHRWLLNNGIVHDSIKNQLFMYGSIVHKDVAAVDLSVDVSKKLVSYRIFISGKLQDKIEKFKKLQDKKTLISLWKFKRLLRKEGNLDFYGILNSFIKDYCGAAWNVDITEVNFESYVEGYKSDAEDINYDIKDDKSTD